MYYGNNEQINYQKSLNEDINNHNNYNNIILISKNSDDNKNNNLDLNNNKYQFTGYFSNSMINQRNNMEPFISQSSQLFSSVQNNNQYRFDIQNKTLDTKNNIIDDYHYKYCPNTNNNNVCNNNNNNNNNLYLSEPMPLKQLNNNNNINQIFSANLMTSPKNNSLSSQISQEIDRQKLKFDEMVERAKIINNSENFEFDLKKYLPKESNFDNSKALRKYKDLIKPNITNRYNYCFSTRNNFVKNLENKDKFDDIKDNTLSEIPIKNENIFEDELSKSELDFNIQSPLRDKDKDNNNIIKENKNNFDNNNLKQINQDHLKQNLLVNVKDNNINAKNNIIYNNVDNNNLNNIINNSPDNSDICFRNNINKKEEQINSNMKDESNKDEYKNIVPFYHIYYEKINDLLNDANNEEYNEDNLNEIEKTNLELIKPNKGNQRINDCSWYCIDYFDDNQDNIYLDFFNKDKI